MAMFITMECLARLGLIKWIGKQTEQLILMADEPMRLSFAIIIILWVNTNRFATHRFIDLLLFFKHTVYVYVCVWQTQRYGRRERKREKCLKKKSSKNVEFKSIAIFCVQLQFSALSSSVVDSTPVTAMMVKVLDSFAQNKSLNLPIKPIVFALAFGPTLGANGNLYGASSNILCAGVAEKHGYKMTCSQYFK